MVPFISEWNVIFVVHLASSIPALKYNQWVGTIKHNITHYLTQMGGTQPPLVHISNICFFRLKENKIGKNREKPWNYHLNQNTTLIPYFWNYTYKNSNRQSVACCCTRPLYKNYCMRRQSISSTSWELNVLCSVWNRHWWRTLCIAMKPKMCSVILRIKIRILVQNWNNNDLTIIYCSLPLVPHICVSGAGQHLV